MLDLARATAGNKFTYVIIASPIESTNASKTTAGGSLLRFM